MASRKSTANIAATAAEQVSGAVAGDRRQDILNSALACFAEGGMEAVSIEMVRQRCGASVGSIYHHFGSKEGIIAALFFAILAEQTQGVQAQLARSKDVPTGVKALVMGYLDWVVAHPDRARFLFQARSVVAGGPRADELATHARERNLALLAWFEPHRRAGVLADIPCEVMPSLVMGPVQSYCRAWLAGSTGMPSPKKYRETLALAAWKAVAA